VPLLVLSRLERSVTANVRKRGEQYVRSGSVELKERPSPDEPVRALVHGSSGDRVTLRYAEGTLLADCTCAFFNEHFQLCKHIWATLIQCEAKKVEFPRPVESVLPDEEEQSWDDEDEDEDEDLYDDDFDDRPFRRADVARMHSLRFGASPQSPPQRWVAPSRWRGQILELSRANQTAASVPPPEIIWVLDPMTSGTSGRVYIEITSRALKKNGELGKPQAVSIERAAIPHAASPVEREVLSILSGASYAQYYGYGTLDTKIAVGWPLSSFVLPKLVETGRLWIRTRSGEYETSVTFDAAEPWHLSVRVEEQKDGGKYVLAATLQRGEESRPIRDALAITQGGFVVFRNSIARFADDGAQRWASLLLRDNVEIPAAELDDFVKSIAPLRASLKIELPPGAAWQERRVAPRASFEFRDRRYGEEIGGVPTFDYDGHTIAALSRAGSISDDQTRTIFVRDTAAEAAFLAALWREGLQAHGESVFCLTWRLPDVIPALVRAGWEVRGAEGIYAVAGDLDLTVSSGIDWFDVDATVSFGTETVRLPRLLAAMRKGESVVPLEDGRMGLVRSIWREQLEPFLATAFEEHDEGLRFRRNQVLLLDALLAKRPEVSFDDVFEQARRRVLDVKIQPEQPRDSFRGALRPYQSEGLGWFAFLRELGFGGCLADDMGLGKTVQVLALLDQRRRTTGEQRQPSLVVAPRSVIFNWKAEAARFTPELRLLDHSTPDRIRAADHFAQHDVVLTTYALLRKEAELFSDVEFDYAILDEAQAIKNASSQAAKAATLLRARHRLALSGTPVENHLGELASLFEFLNPGMLRAKSSGMMKMLRHAGSKAAEAADARVMLSRAVRPFILRRTKAQVAPELPDRIEQTIWCELEPKQRKLYDELRDYYRASLLGRVAKDGMNRSKIHILEALLRMRQAACHPGLVDKKRTAETSAKLDTLFEELPILIEGGHKVLVFSQFTSLLSIVRKETEQRGFAHAYIDGASRDREAQVQRFQEDSEVPLFLISLKAGGLGLNLTAAEYVFLLDPWWNPAVEAQAIDRAHRIGQSRNVFAYRLVARDTIEEKILQLQATKRDLADAIISEENSILRQLTPEDLDLLLS